MFPYCTENATVNLVNCYTASKDCILHWRAFIELLFNIVKGCLKHVTEGLWLSTLVLEKMQANVSDITTVENPTFAQMCLNCDGAGKKTKLCAQ